MKLEIFIASEKDYLDLAKLRYEFKAGKTEYDMSFLESYCNYLKAESNIERIKIFCARVDNRIIGNVNLILVPTSPKPGSYQNKLGYVTNTFIRPLYRNNGIGTVMMKKLKDYAIKNNIELLFVWPGEESVNFYKRLGFNSENDILEFLIEDI